MKHNTRNKMSAGMAGSILLVGIVSLLFWACPLSGETDDSSAGGEGLTGMWESVLTTLPATTGYDLLYINENGTYTEYFCFTADFITFTFLSGNSSNRGTYTVSGDQLTMLIDDQEYYEDAWQQSVDETIQPSFTVAGDTLTVYGDWNDDGDYDDERETVVYERRATAVDIDGDGDVLD